jgi:hypothetical protein
MDVNKLMLSRIFDSTERLDAPLFQRPYVWNRDRNWDPLWEAIETLAQKRVVGSPVRPHFLRANRRSNIHLYPDDWKKLPIPDVDAKAQAPIVNLVDQILAARHADPKADIADLEREVDGRVAELYGVAG